jgi:threonine/homoserine/homoserine lactone efflux protein
VEFVSNSLIYWILLGVAFAITMLAGIILMRSTQRIGLSISVSNALNLLITAGTMIWFISATKDQLWLQMGVVVLGISFLNSLVLSFFAILSIRKKV